jgi:hypothetical protein
METTFSISLLLPGFITLIVIGLIGFTAYMLFGGNEKLKVKRRDETSQRFLQEKTPTLLPWEPAKALRDLSSLCVRTAESSAIGPWSHCRGTVRSLSNRRASWLAFTVNRQNRDGSIVVHTSASEIMITVHRAFTSEDKRQAEILIDNRVLGYYNLNTREFFDETGKPIGRITGGKLILMQGISNYVTVKMRGSEIAQMNTQPFSWFEGILPMPPVFKPYRHNLTTQEQWWLVALYAIALYRNCLSSNI